MIVLENYPIAFIHSPKTGGSTITRALADLDGVELPGMDQRGWQGKMHKGGQHGQWKLEDVPPDYTLAMTVRHPLDRMLSFWAYFSAEDEGLDEFALRWTARAQGEGPIWDDRYPLRKPSSAHLMSQWSYGMKDGKQAVKRFIFFESLQESFDILCEYVSAPRVALGHELDRRDRNYQRTYRRPVKETPKDWREAYQTSEGETAETIFLAQYHDDFTRLGYG